MVLLIGLASREGDCYTSLNPPGAHSIGKMLHKQTPPKTCVCDKLLPFVHSSVSALEVILLVGKSKESHDDLSILFNLVQFILYASEGFTICTHMTSLTFDLTLDQEKLPRIRKKPFREKREEIFRRATEEDPSPGWTEAIYVMCTE